MKILKPVQAYMSFRIAERIVLSFLTRNIPLSADLNYMFGEEVLVISEEEKNGYDHISF